MQIAKIKHSGFWANLFKTQTSIEDLSELLLTIPPFQKLNRKDIASLMEIIHTREYQSHEAIFLQGDPGIGLYIIQDGEVIIEKLHEDGRKYVLSRFYRGDFFGELALLDNSIRSASAIAVKNSKIAVIFKPDLDDFIDRYPKKGINILRGIGHIVAIRLRTLNQDFVSLYLNSIKNEGAEDGKRNQ